MTRNEEIYVIEIEFKAIFKGFKKKSPVLCYLFWSFYVYLKYLEYFKSVNLIFVCKK